jgi:hypothetical protein
MVKIGKTLNNLLYGGAIALASFLPMKNANAQQYVVNPFVPTNGNGIELADMKTRAQRDSLVQAKLNEDWTSEIAPSTNPLWDCTEYSKQLCINFHGFDGLEGYAGDNLDSIYSNHGTLKDNGKYGLPVYNVVIPTGSGHEMNAILTGNDATKWENWNFIEPQFDQTNIQPGQAYMSDSCEVTINYSYVNENDNLLDDFPILKFKVENGTPSLIWKINDPNVKLIAKRDTIPPKINISSPLEGIIYDESPQLNYEFIDDNLKEASYQINGASSQSGNLNQSGTKDLNLSDGNYQLITKAKDYFNLENSDTINFSVKKITGLEDEVSNSKIKFGPNPTTDRIDIKYNAEKCGKIYTEIYSTDGKLVDSHVDEVFQGENLIDIDISDKANGIYLMQITSDGKTHTEKIVKE